MFIYILGFLVITLSRYLWQNKHFFNKDHLKNFGDDNAPLIKNGFYLALMDAGEKFSIKVLTELNFNLNLTLNRGAFQTATKICRKIQEINSWKIV